MLKMSHFSVYSFCPSWWFITSGAMYPAVPHLP